MDREGTLVKRKKARVVDVLRKAAVLDIEGENATRTVRFSELQLKRPTQPPPPPPRRKLHAVAAPAPEPEPEPEPSEPEPEPEPSEPEPEADPTLDEWVAQGVKVQEKLIQQAHEVENAMKALEEEQLALMLQADQKKAAVEEKRKELEALRQRIVLLDTLRSGIA
jgi:hypothetical protein